MFFLSIYIDLKEQKFKTYSKTNPNGMAKKAVAGVRSAAPMPENAVIDESTEERAN